MPANVQILPAAGSRKGFGRVVGDARRSKRLTQEQAAALLGMSRRKLIDIEADRIELPRYERAGILAVLSPERGTTAPAATRRTWRRVLLGSPNRPRAWLDIEEEAGQWWAAIGFDNGSVGGLDTFKGPFAAREAAERNAAAFGCDFMKARGCHVQRAIVRRMFGFPLGPDKRAKPAPNDAAQDERTNPVCIVPNPSNRPKAFHIVEAPGDCRIFECNEQPIAFYTLNDAVLWALTFTPFVAVDLECRRWADSSP
jgi:transcriptional regulator with XRE-family HTH domain